jgi:aryl-alcohol dehydrogenase-like predicted oxidoreductase
VIKQTIIGTDIEVPLLGLGTVKIGRNQGVKYPVDFSLPDDQSVKKLLSQAYDLGINFIDTAPAYGSSEERLGRLLPGKRTDWVIMTKAGEEFKDAQSSYDFSHQHIVKSIKRSLQQLKTDYLDIVLIHSNGDDVNIIENEDVFGTLAELKRQGLIRSFGFSAKTVDGGKLAVDHADVVMVSFNPNDRACEAVIDYAHEKQTAVFIKKALASGHLCQKAGTDMTALFRFLFEKPGVTSAIVGTINGAHLTENARSLVLALDA